MIELGNITVPVSKALRESGVSKVRCILLESNYNGMLENWCKRKSSNNPILLSKYTTQQPPLKCDFYLPQ